MLLSVQHKQIKQDSAMLHWLAVNQTEDILGISDQGQLKSFICTKGNMPVHAYVIGASTEAGGKSKKHDRHMKVKHISHGCLGDASQGWYADCKNE